MTFNGGSLCGPVNIVIANRQRIYIEGFKAMVSNQPFINIVGEACSGMTLLDIVAEKKPAIVYACAKILELGGMEVTRKVMLNSPASSIIAMGGYNDRALLLQMLKAGVNGFLHDNFTIKEIVSSIHSLTLNSYYYSSTQNDLSDTVTSTCPVVDFQNTSLSKRDITIVRLICEQKTSKEIACELHMHYRAVEGARERMQKKVGVKNIAGLVIYAIKHGHFRL